jgi:amidophosphoribosyltransferase
MCGIVGFYEVENAAGHTALALQSTQHRGDSGAGIVASDGADLRRVRDPGRVERVFENVNFAKRLPGRSAIGHNRYPTSGKANERRLIQPLMNESETLPMAVAHNGNVADALTLRLRLAERGAVFASRSDSELFLHYPAALSGGDMVERFKYTFSQIRAAYSLVFLTPTEMYAAVDPYGFHPLHMAPYQGGTMAASETVAFAIFDIDPKTIREIAPGTIVDIGRGKTHVYAESPATRHCAFEYGYFARPDGNLWGMEVGAVRDRMGRLLAEHCPADADLVVAVPDSSNFQALSFSRASGIPLGLGLVRSHYFARTFIDAVEVRGDKARMKYGAVPDVVAGKRIVLVDDSIVRGLTMEKVIAMLRKAGAREVHVRSALPPIIHPCHWGIDMQTFKELIAVGRSVDEIRRAIGADTLAYLPLEALREALLDPQGERHCLTCFTGVCPLANIRRK